MTDSSQVASRLLQIATQASRETIEERNFPSLLAATRQNFRRNSPNARGRKRKAYFSTSVLLLKLAHAEFGPGKPESNLLKRRGLGLANKKLEVGRNMEIQEIKESIIQLYPPNIQALLTMCGFKLGKLTKSRKIELLGNINDGSDLEHCLKQSMLVVLPLNDFPDDLPLIQTDAISDSQTSSRSRPTSSTLTNTRVRNDDSDFSDQNSFSGSPTVPRSIRNNRRTRVLSRQQFVEQINLSDEETESDEADVRVVEEAVNENFLTIPQILETAEKIKVSISRQNCLHDLLNVYNDEQILNKTLNVEFLGEPGIDGGGLTKELFNIFLLNVQNNFFVVKIVLSHI